MNIEMENCDDCQMNIMVEQDIALELTRIYYNCSTNKSNRYYKDDVMEAYNYFKRRLNEKEGEEEETNEDED